MNSDIWTDLAPRSQTIFQQIVQNYLDTGQPVGSKTLVESVGLEMSSATVRAIMVELEQAGLLYAPHISSGRLPTHAGLRLFVDGLMGIGGQLSSDEQASIDGAAKANGLSVNQAMDKASQALSGLSKCASLVVSQPEDFAVQHIEFVPVQDRKLLVILVFSNGQVENRLIDMPAGLTSHTLVSAGNYLSHLYRDQTIGQITQLVSQDIDNLRAELGERAAALVKSGLAAWSDGEGAAEASLIIHGQSHLLSDIDLGADLDDVRALFDVIELRHHMHALLGSISGADGLQIFIGSEHPLFQRTGHSLILAPYSDSQNRIVGAVGVIGPRHMNYAKIIPMVDYTSQAVRRLLD